VRTVAVLGGGLMGSGIAESAAVAGYDVVVREVADRAVDAARGRIEKSLSRAKIDDAAKADALARIELTTSPADLEHADLLVEAVPEDLDLKRRVLHDVVPHLREDAIVSSNTSSIPIAQLAQVVPGPDRVLGMHFFSPVPVMKLVELVRALETADVAIEACRGVSERMGKTAIETKDRSGFVVNMLLVPYLTAAVRMFEEGFASREDIDAGMQLGCGHPMGPLRLCDLIGIDVLQSVCDSLFEEFKRPEYAPPPLMKRMVAAGRCGRKTGRGFYEYG
jgi:3-hydroxybutyryl-CoA dehydrogenase